LFGICSEGTPAGGAWNLEFSADLAGYLSLRIHFQFSEELKIKAFPLFFFINPF